MWRLDISGPFKSALFLDVSLALLLGGAPLSRASTATVTASASAGTGTPIVHTNSGPTTAAVLPAVRVADGASAAGSAILDRTEKQARDNAGKPVTVYLPYISLLAASRAGGDEHAVGAAGAAEGTWTDTLKFDNPLFIPPIDFLQLFAVFQCELDGVCSGPVGSAQVSVTLRIDRIDVNGDPVRYEKTKVYTAPHGVNETLNLAVPTSAFVGGIDKNGHQVFPTFTLSISVNAHSAYGPGENSPFLGDGFASFNHTFKLETIYYADANGNPVRGYDDVLISGDNGPYAVGAPTAQERNEIVAIDRFGRRLNERGMTLVDWEGQIANPAIAVSIVPPQSATYPATATVSCPQTRVYFDEPCTVGASGPTKTLSFPDNTPVPLMVSIFPDRDGDDEDWPITVNFTSHDGTTSTLTFNAHVIDQDQPARSIEWPITVDFSRDQTGFFADPARRALYQQMANDWAYYFADPGLDTVAAGAETTFIWNATGFIDGSFITNAGAYRGYLLYAYGINQASPPYRSGGEPSSAGGFLSAGGVSLNLRRSGGQEIEVKGNYNTLGWTVSLADDDWWAATNLGDVPNDLASIAHHEMGHAFIFNPAQPVFSDFKNSSTSSVLDTRVYDYQGSLPAIDASDHLAGAVDRLSGRGAFGNEYYGTMPARRWLITKLDLLVAQAIGYKLRVTSPFVPASIVTPSLGRGGVGGYYRQTLQAQGGVPIYYWSVTGGSLPPGLALDSVTGAITGTPTDVGSYTFTVRLDEYDNAAPPVYADYTIRVEATPFGITQVQRTPTASVSYRTSASQTYRVEYSDDLQTWTTLATDIAGTGSVVTTADPTGGAQPKRFYRVTEM